VDGTALAGEKNRDFGTNEAGGAGDEGFHAMMGIKLFQETSE
jgi:hypothetical protein